MNKAIYDILLNKRIEMAESIKENVETLKMINEHIDMTRERRKEYEKLDEEIKYKFINDSYMEETIQLSLRANTNLSTELATLWLVVTQLLEDLEICQAEQSS